MLRSDACVAGFDIACAMPIHCQHESAPSARFQPVGVRSRTGKRSGARAALIKAISYQSPGEMRDARSIEPLITTLNDSR